jgi:hypothetical protein
LLVVGDAEVGVPTGIAEIHVTSSPERDRPGRSGLLNDADQMVFRGVMADSSQAVYLAQGS